MKMETKIGKINIAELLKDCPKGMELYSTIFGVVYFEGVKDTGNAVLIDVKTMCNSEYQFYPDGKFNTYYSDSEMTLFPSKDVRTWEGFVPPCQFKDGDVITCTNSAGSFVAIFKKMYTDTTFIRYVTLTLDDEQLRIKDSWSDFKNPRFATEEEQEKLFQVIKEHGYQWNAETKTLEKLVEPKFKVGDRIKWKGHDAIGRIEDIQDSVYHVDFGYDDGVVYVGFRIQDDYELVPNKFDVNALKPFDKVLVRDNNEQLWLADLFGFYGVTPYPFMCVGHYTNQCIPYEGNEHLLGKTDECDDYYKNWK